MILERKTEVRKKSVVLINDVPVKKEIACGMKFSAISNTNLIGSLRTGKLNQNSKKLKEIHTGILPTLIHTTYLTYSFFYEEGNFDFKNDFCKRKDLEHSGEFFHLKNDLGKRFIRLEHQKDCFISERLWNDLQDTLNEIKQSGAKYVICTGKWTLFLLSGCTTLGQNISTPSQPKPLGCLMKFRSSIMEIHPCFGEVFKDIVLYPIIHPVNALTMPDKASYIELDLQRAGWIYSNISKYGTKYYQKDIKIYHYGLDFEKNLQYLKDIKNSLDKEVLTIACDIETQQASYIDCIGLALSKDEGFCFPFSSKETLSIWTQEEEFELLFLIKEILEHKNIRIIGQNFNYDSQFLYHKWGIACYATYDTMGIQHTLYSFTPKDLAFLASLYCEKYSYWKDELTVDEERREDRWRYNIKDICITYEVFEQIWEDLTHRGNEKLLELYKFQQWKLNPIIIETMVKGVKIDVAEKEKLYTFFAGLCEKVLLEINDLLGMEFNPNSTPQKKKLFKDFLEIKLKTKRVKGSDDKETMDAAAMVEYLEEYPKYFPLLRLILEYGSLKVFTKNFLGAKLDENGYIHTSYNIFGPYTGRFSSSKDVFGNGANLQNLPEKGKLPLILSEELVDENVYEFEGEIELPNVKKMFIPEEGFGFIDLDLSGADIQIVAADCECNYILDFYENPRGNGKIYHWIASEFFQKEISKEEYKTYKGVFHGTNYLMRTRKLAQMAGISEKLANELQKFYFSLCPEIPKIWHKGLEIELKNKGYVENIYGRRAYFPNTNDPLRMNKVAAFRPQSTIAHVINLGIAQVIKRNPQVKLALQVHDSGVFRVPIKEKEVLIPKIQKDILVEIPFKKPLTIAVDFKYSEKSYGHKN